MAPLHGLDRRRFLRWLGGTAAGFAASSVLDLDKLLWVPGAKQIYLPSPSIVVDTATGISLRFVQQWDAYSVQAVNRFDVIYSEPMIDWPVTGTWVQVDDDGPIA